MIYPLVALTIALFISLVVTPIARRVALRVGLVDHPDAHRKLHREPVALCGGVAVLISLIASVALMLGVREDIASASTSNIYQAIAMTLGAISIVALGVLDDRIGLRGRQKLAGQVLICVSLIAFGFTIPRLSLLGWEFELGVLVVPVTLGWLLLAVNSVNLIDGADGLCSSVGWIACASLSAIGYWTGNVVESILAASMAGALLGFLFFNLPPAKVFLGDAGSMLVGLVLGVLAMRCSVTGNTPLPIMVPIALMAIPLFDSSMAIIRRKLTGRSVFTVDRGHLHHNLMRLGIRNQWLVGAITLLSVVTSGGAVLSVLAGTDLIAVAAILLAMGLLIATRAFGFAELELLGTRVWCFTKSLLARRGLAENTVRIQKVRLQGSREWEIVWSTFVEFAEKHSLAKISLDLNMPWLHEGFHANWNVNSMPEIADRWQVKLPIESEGRILGRLEIIGKYQGPATYDVLAYLSDMLVELQPSIESVINGFESVQVTSETSRVPGSPRVVQQTVPQAVQELAS